MANNGGSHAVQMNSLYRHLQNPLTRARNDRDRTLLVDIFPDLQSSQAAHFLALRCYLDGIPEKFFDRRIYQTYLQWLHARDQIDRKALCRYLSEFSAGINRALIFLREINSEDWHDSALDAQDKGSDYGLIQRIDRIIHPNYLRLIEGVFTPLTRPMAHFSRIDRKSGADGLDTWQIVEELRRHSWGPELIGPYEHTVRNGIGHGGITFLQNEIIYQDKRGNRETHHVRSIVRLFDDLVDTCNGLAAALKMFYLTFGSGGYRPPREMLVEELQEETRSPWWIVEGCVESQVVDKSQLIVYAQASSRRLELVQYATYQSGVLSELFAPGYDRYMVSAQSRKTWIAWAIFDGKKLRTLRKCDAADLSQYGDAVESSLFYSIRWLLPKVLGKVDSIVRSFKINYPVAWQEVNEKMGTANIVCRNAAVHRNSWGCVLHADVVIDGLDNETVAEIVRKNRGRMLRLAKRHARQANRSSLAAYLPIGFAQVNVFRRDYRRRRLSGFGLGDDLVCTVRRQRIRRIKAPDILRSTVEMSGTWRIAWNEAWLNAIGHKEDD